LPPQMTVWRDQSSKNTCFARVRSPKSPYSRTHARSARSVESCTGSGQRRKARDRCLSVTVKSDGSAVLNCWHCGWRGATAAGVLAKSLVRDWLARFGTGCSRDRGGSCRRRDSHDRQVASQAAGHKWHSPRRTRLMFNSSAQQRMYDQKRSLESIVQVRESQAFG
jgi:hypothetical protein